MKDRLIRDNTPFLLSFHILHDAGHLFPRLANFGLVQRHYFHNKLKGRCQGKDTEMGVAVVAWTQYEVWVLLFHSL